MLSNWFNKITTPSFTPDSNLKQALCLKNIHVSFGSRSLIDEVNLDIHQGELTILLGPNGTGKSSLLKTITNEIEFSGECHLYGIPIKSWPRHTLAKHLGVLPQHSQLSFNFSAREVVELGGLNLTIEKSKLDLVVESNMAKTDILHLANRSYPTLSGGEKQRVHLARVLTQLEQSGDEKVLLMDEPTSALDIQHQHRTLQLAKSLVKTGGTVVVVLHDLNLAAQYADRIVILNKGKIASNGTPQQAIQVDIIEQVYQHRVEVLPHPTHGYPVVMA